jgi:hypothetical protein
VISLDARRAYLNGELLSWSSMKDCGGDKPATDVRREAPHPKSSVQNRTVTAKKPAARRPGLPL